MGVTRPVVYACYGGRGEVLAALLDRETDSVLTSLLAILPPQKTSTVEQMFVDGFRALLTVCSQRPAAWRIILAADPDPVLTGAIARGRAQVGDRVSAVMRSLLERWAVEAIDGVLPALTEAFVALCEAAVRMLLDAGNHQSSDELAEIFGKAAYRVFRV
jgi:AcrR family transcriptional regulator